MADEKTEQPTPRRIKKARKEGNFPKTQDAATWMAIAAAFALVPHTVHTLDAEMQKMFATLPDVGKNADPAYAMRLLAEIPGAVFKSILPICVAATGAAVLATASQGVYLTSENFKFKFKKLNPVPGVKRMFGPSAAWEAIKALLKVGVVGIVIYQIGKGLLPELAGQGALPLSTTVERARSGLSAIVWSSVGAGLVLAVADYAYQRRKIMKKLKMSLKEIKDENKQSEGDPMVKSQMRQRAMAMARNRMMSALPTADVVLVNPTHISVALKYEPGLGAPRVVAKGAGAVALRIREVAASHQVPLVEDKPLARTLYRVCEVNEEIPSELFVAVARILAFVMSAGKPSKAAAAKPRVATNRAEVPDVPARAVLRQRRLKEMRDARSGATQEPPP